MVTALEKSLKLLGTDYIDLYQLHSPQPKWPIEETMRNLIELKTQGKIRYIGISNYDDQQTREALSYGPIHSSQPRYNILFRETEVSTIPFCLNNGIGVIAHSVLAKGLLSGKYKIGSQFAEDDERQKVYGNMQGKQFERIFAFLEDLSNWASDNGRDLLQLAIAWVNAQPGITSSIIGAKTSEQVLHSAKAGDWNLSKTDLQEIENMQGNLRLDFQQLRKDED
jgi:aryl-alcohol dehydrogenase-like predicted oxidoreductase